MEENDDWVDRNGNAIYKCPGKTKSSVWKYFGFIKTKDGPAVKSNLEMGRAICRLCKKSYSNNEGPMIVNKNVPPWTHLQEGQSHLLPGGRYKPANCTARHRVAIIIPYRDRENHLKVLLQNLHPMLQRQQLDYGIYVVELEASVKFNRAILLNIGFVEASKEYDYQCFIFHDVDLVPEDDRNLYNCPQIPRHMSAAIDKHKYTTLYDTLFGGVSALTKEHFIKVNGYSNKYFGWGGEDDDMFTRITENNLNFTRYSVTIARYKMMDHKQETPTSPESMALLNATATRRLKDGLNTLKYTLFKKEYKPLYTRVYVYVNRTEITLGGV